MILGVTSIGGVVAGVRLGVWRTQLGVSAEGEAAAAAPDQQAIDPDGRAAAPVAAPVAANAAVPAAAAVAGGPAAAVARGPATVPAAVPPPVDASPAQARPDSAGSTRPTR